VNIGTRELKNRLSHYLRHVREDGVSIFITDRGRVIAELRPISARKENRADRAVLAELAATGEVSMGGQRFKDVRPAASSGNRSISDFVIEDRR